MAGYTTFLKSAIAIALLVGAFLVFYSPEPDRQLPVEEVTSNVQSGTLFTNSAGGFEFVIPPGWSFVNQATLPVGFTNAQFFLKKNGTGCVLSYAKSSSSISTMYTQFSFGERVSSDEYQFDPSWYISKDKTPDNLKFSFNERQPLPGEVEVEYYANRQSDADVFILFNADASIVDESCARDVSSIFKSVRTVFEQVTLDSNSEGVARIDFSPTYRKSALFFKAKDEKLWKEVVAMSVNQEIAPVIYDNKIYFIDNEALKTLDPFSREITPVPGIETTEQYQVNGIYFAKGNLYYLAGKYCAEYMGKCSLDLYEHNLQTHQNRLLTSGIKGHNIRGYKKDSDTLYISSDFGDAGCYSTKLFLFDFKTGLLRQGDSFGGCAEEERVPSETEKAYAVIEKYFETIVPRIGWFEIKGGKIIEPTGDSVDINQGMTLKFVR